MGRPSGTRLIIGEPTGGDVTPAVKVAVEAEVAVAPSAVFNSSVLLLVAPVPVLLAAEPLALDMAPKLPAAATVAATFAAAAEDAKDVAGVPPAGCCAAGGSMIGDDICWNGCPPGETMDMGMPVCWLMMYCT